MNTFRVMPAQPSQNDLLQFEALKVKIERWKDWQHKSMCDKLQVVAREFDGIDVGHFATVLVKHADLVMKTLEINSPRAIEPDSDYLLQEWLMKTEWVQERKNWPIPTLGSHRADVMKAHIEHLENLLREPRK